MKALVSTPEASPHLINNIFTGLEMWCGNNAMLLNVSVTSYPFSDCQPVMILTIMLEEWSSEDGIGFVFC